MILLGFFNEKNKKWKSISFWVSIKTVFKTFFMKNFYNYLIYHGEGLPQGKKTDCLDFMIKNK